MPITFDGKLVIAISSRALFDMSESHHVYETQGVETYAKYQIAHENEILKKGVAFHLVQKLLRINKTQDNELVEVILLSRNSADTGLRVFNSIKHYGLNITRAAFSSGDSPYAYVSAFGSHLFLSTHPEDVCKALEAGYAAATISPQGTQNNDTHELRIAFDGDAVIFSDESERIFQEQGLAAFAANEAAKAEQPLEGGPFKAFLQALQVIQRSFPEKECPIRTALVTARSAPSHERVIKTLRHWNIRIDEALFLGGLAKGEFLKAFKADFFFDDQKGHCNSAAEQMVATGHVPHGITNKQ
ncbi:MAG: 5'-nucleotidase [Gammaproteobacteria bacterium]|nr:5'-nucleotidase [Gammaproteobacteria bacterium]